MMRSTSAKPDFLIELTVPWEEEVEAAYKRKRAEYSELAVKCKVAGFKDPVEVKCPCQALETWGFRESSCRQLEGSW